MAYKKAQNNSKQRSSMIKVTLKFYAIICYIIMGFFIYEFYQDYKEYVKKHEEIRGLSDNPSAENLFKVIKTAVNESDQKSFKVRDEEYIKKKAQELMLGFIFSPCAVAYYFIVKKGNFPTF